MKFTFQTQHTESNTLLSDAVSNCLIDLEDRTMVIYFDEVATNFSLNAAIDNHIKKGVQNMIVDTDTHTYALYVVPTMDGAVPFGKLKMSYSINAYTKTLNIDKED